MNTTKNGVITADHASQQGHWYKQDGTPAYTVIGKNGKERNTTLRDAKKLGLLPSVTSIIKCAAAPGLELWKSQQVLMAALTTDRLPEETETAYIDRIIKDSREQAEKARERGTQIHAIVQSGFEKKLDVISSELEYFYSAQDTLEKECGDVDWQCEESFATNRYGGKVDLHSEEYLIDIKTSLKPMSDVKIWPEHYQQLSAYRFGLFGENSTVHCGILFINTDTAESRFILADEESLEKGFLCFSALVSYFYASTGL